ncbi:AraC family transcriptional regulator [Stella humosa]|uniref:AraC family transcriptional regulator n=1 Tax=Stella humosa TaxID=94 RepID=A0A3N1KQ25_9PROT|nr:AraC family transcriptional regulator [Stella humosa]ROP83893.1 AraC family transcriptional regulator [Stella humosa]BBK32845.1 hypothetical protein STHU_34790 [Stella humosa]
MAQRVLEPRSQGWRSFGWGQGSFDTAHRPPTPLVEGTIHTPDHLVLVTLRGGARRIEVSAAGGHRYAGPDRPGAVSFVPADCERRLVLRDVATEWASIALVPDAIPDLLDGDGRMLDLPAFSNGEDPFVAGMVGEMARLHAADGNLQPLYCETMSRALACYLVRRYGTPRPAAATVAWHLPAWRLRRIEDYVEANLAADIRVADLARLVGLSAGHLHRAFRATTGTTPLEFINRRRIHRASAILATEGPTVAEVALRVGFLSPSHFTRTFRRVTGRGPSARRPGP